ncbi:phosphopyruvate hydratase [Marasmitruncus massiliensis]|uniref:phosphopyruvate hydratase n=1 Tax=Marasmitruncus massiliensis TaxID=1944642 RepID=UPI000C7E610C|nr:phosphopyruvate hydratase [Marasmitruncus massiliensis]MBE6906926.1 phosphopyruvate hydratase [Oscillospiraceae bacterium]
MNDYEIVKVQARQVFDSRANPTVEVDVTLACGAVGRGTVPSGASTGIYEALELRDGGKELGGKSVRKAIKNIETELAPALLNRNALHQAELDQMMIALDGTPNKSRLGANAILGCSMAVAHAAANAKEEPLFRYLGGANAKTIPVPMIQIIGGGAHAVGSIDIQDFLVIPLRFKSFEEGFAAVVNVYNAAKKVFTKTGRPLAIADEGGFWPTNFTSNEEGLALLTESIRLAGYEPGVDIGIALDIASSEFYDKDKGTYKLSLENLELTSAEFVDLLCGWVEKYPIISIEDGCSELDWEGSVLLTQKLGRKIQLIGDDLFTTNIQRIRTGVERGACNSVLIKMNQIGTITETLDAIEYTKNSGYLPVISARSGETEDSTIVHLAIATNAGQLKVGSVARSERTVKWNEAIRMEELLGDEGVYLGGDIFNRVIKS